MFDAGNWPQMSRLSSACETLALVLHKLERRHRATSHRGMPETEVSPFRPSLCATFPTTLLALSLAAAAQLRRRDTDAKQNPPQIRLV